MAAKSKLSVSGRELELMVEGKKPMAVFFKAVKEKIDEKSGQSFDIHVKTGSILEGKFYIKNQGQNFRLIYTVYYKKEEEWRFQLYKLLKKIGQKNWNNSLARLECWLLEYCE